MNFTRSPSASVYSISINAGGPIDEDDFRRVNHVRAPVQGLATRHVAGVEVLVPLPPDVCGRSEPGFLMGAVIP